jgi:hypothetical protein
VRPITGKTFPHWRQDWCDFTANYGKQWLSRDEELATRKKNIIGSLRKMLTFFSSPLGVRVIQILPKCYAVVAIYFFDNDLQEIERSNCELSRKM